jgi:Ni2+-binding GTPase involved in maturation of urease and hydrogenase
MYHNEFKLEVRAKNENEELVVRTVAVLGDSNSGKTAIFAKALKIDEKRFNEIL